MAIAVPSFVRMMRNSSVSVIPGTAFFLTGEPARAACRVGQELLKGQAGYGAMAGRRSDGRFRPRPDVILTGFDGCGRVGDRLAKGKGELDL